MLQIFINFFQAIKILYWFMLLNYAKLEKLQTEFLIDEIEAEKIDNPCVF